MKKQVIIIGAGIGGIATANMLAKAGFKVDVYEKNSAPGGRAGIHEIDGFRFDTGPSWYLMPEVFSHYFSLFKKDVNQELNLTKLSPAYKVFFENKKPVVITGVSEKDTATFESIESGSGEKLKKYIAKGNDIYQLSLKYFLYTNFTSPRDFLKREVLKKGLTMLRLAFTPIDTYVSKFVSDTRLKQILEYPMVFLGSSPFSAPAIYNLMSALDFREGVFYPQGGIYKIIERLIALSEELGVTYHYNAPVKKILVTNKQASGIQLYDESKVIADIVISNADLHFTETKLLDEVDQSYPSSYWNKKDPGPSALLIYLGVKDDLPNLEHHNLFFVDDWKTNFDNIFTNKMLPSPASIYLCKPSQTDLTVAPKGHENLFVLVPLPADPSIMSEKTEQIADTYLRQIEKSMGIPDLRERIVYKKLFSPTDFVSTYNAWQGTALGPSHLLRQSAFFRSSNKSRKVNNLYYVGGFTTPGIGLPMCLISAELIYKRLAGDKLGGPITEIKPIAGAQE